MIDPQIGQILDLLAATGGQGLSAGTVEQARQAFDLVTVGARQPGALPQVGGTEDLVLPSGDAARVYRPEGEGPWPTLLLFHGGGFVLGSLETHDDQARLLCRDAGVMVVSVDYPLAPEHPFPQAHDACLAATRWVAERLGELGGDGRLVVGGDSAGGNLAASVAIACRDAGGPALAGQLLLYPAVDFDSAGDYPSRWENGEGYFLTAQDMLWFGEHLAADPTDPRVSVIAADLTGLPPAVVVTAEYDPLRDEGEAYAKALEHAGVPVTLRRADGMIHGFFGLFAFSTGAAEASRGVCEDLRALLA